MIRISSAPSRRVDYTEYLKIATLILQLAQRGRRKVHRLKVKSDSYRVIRALKVDVKSSVFKVFSISKFDKVKMTYFN